MDGVAAAAIVTWRRTGITEETRRPCASRAHGRSRGRGCGTAMRPCICCWSCPAAWALKPAACLIVKSPSRPEDGYGLRKIELPHTALSRWRFFSHHLFPTARLCERHLFRVEAAPCGQLPGRLCRVWRDPRRAEPSVLGDMHPRPDIGLACRADRVAKLLETIIQARFALDSRSIFAGFAPAQLLAHKRRRTSSHFSREGSHVRQGRSDEGDLGRFFQPAVSTQ